MKYILPIKLQKNIYNLLSNAEFLCIILNYDNMYPWFYEHYVQVYINETNLLRQIGVQEVLLDFYGGWTEPRELFDILYFNRKEVESYGIDEFKELIQKGYYMYVYLDESYVYECEPNSHDNLIYGFDDEKRVFYLIGFVEDQYEMYEIDYDVFVEAYRSGVKISAETDVYDGINFLCGFKPKFNENTKYEFQFDKFLQRMEELVYSINSAEIYSDGSLNHKMYEGEKLYGFDAIKRYCEMLEDNKETLGELDLRAFHTIYEHCNLMYDRLKYIYNEILREEMDSNLEKKLEELVKKSERIRLLSVKYNVSLKKKLIPVLIEDMKELLAGEVELYTKIYHELCEKQQV